MNVSVGGVSRSEPAPSNGFPRHWTRAVELTLIGGFSLRIGDKQVELPLSAQRLIAFLALHPGRLRRAFVAGSLWMDVSEQRAHARLRTAVWRCSRPELALLTSTSTHVGLDPRVSVERGPSAAVSACPGGARVEAVRQYRRFATRLQSDLGLTPTERLTSLLDAADVNHTLAEHRFSVLDARR